MPNTRKTPRWVPERGAERILRDSHFWFAGDSIVIHDIEGRIVDCNEQATASLGYSRTELLNLRIPDIAVLTEADEAPWDKLSPGGAMIVESVCKAKSGASFPVEVCVRHVMRDEQSVFVAIIRDITQRKKAGDEIQRLLNEVRQEKDKLLRLIDSMSDEVWFSDENLNIVLANAAARQTFGLQSPQTDLKTLLNILEILRPDGTVRPASEAPPIRALAGETVRNSEEIVRIPQTGQTHYRQVSSSPVRDADGRITGTVSVVRDLTRQKTSESLLKKSEQEFGSLLDLLPVGVSILDAERRIVKVNRSLLRILDVSEEALMHGRHKERRYLREDGSPMPQDDMPSVVALKERRVVENVQIGVVKEDGTTVWGLVSAAPLPDGGAVVVTRDFTRQKKTIEILDRRAREVEDANAALRVLLRQREQDKTDIEQSVMENISKLVLPHLDRLASSLESSEDRAHVNIIGSALNTITSSFSTALSHKLGSLSPKEIQIAHMVKVGKRDKEIAKVLNLSEPTIRAHRRNIRRKLGLTGRKVNLRSFLSYTK